MVHLVGFFPEFHAKVELKDKIRNCIFIEKRFVLKYYEHEYDTIQYEYIEDVNATLCVKYVTYRATVTATVEVVLRKKGDEDLSYFYLQPKNEQSVDGADVVGIERTIIGSHHYTKTDSDAHSHGGSDCCCITLATFPKDSVKVTLVTSVSLSRSVLAVPAYLLFLIDMDIMVCGSGCVRNVVEFSADDCGALVRNLEVPGELVLQLKFTWTHVYCEFQDMMEMEEVRRQEIESSNSGKKMKVTDPNTDSSTFILYNIPIDLEFKGERLMQVFSVSLWLKNDKFCNVYGSNLSLIVDLKVNNQQFCKGYINWSGFRLQKRWFDKRLCSVIKGNEEALPLSSKYTGELIKGTGVPLLLSRPLVCVPSDSSLTIDVKLAASVETQESKPKDVGFSGRAECIIGCNMCWVIESQAHQLCISVDWSTILRAPSSKKKYQFCELFCYVIDVN